MQREAVSCHRRSASGLPEYGRAVAVVLALVFLSPGYAASEQAADEGAIRGQHELVFTGAK